MALPVYPTLSRLPQIEGFDEGTLEKSGIESSTESGNQLTRAKYTAVAKTWNFNYTRLTAADKALLKNPRLAQSLIAKALYHQNKYQAEQALPYFEKALEFHPENSDANYQLSIINNRMAEYDLALKYGLKALESETVEVKIAAINYEIGNAYYNNAELDLACEAFKKALVDVIEDIARAKMERIPGCE